MPVQIFPTQNLLEWFKNTARPLPWRKEYIPYHVLLSEMMLQQTQVATAMPYYQRWLKKWPNWKSLGKAHEDEVLKMWEGLGYYQRARRLLELAQTVVDKHHGILPDQAEALAKLPGFGPYTTAAVCAIAFNQIAFPIDGNVRRVLSRFTANSLVSPCPEQDEIFNQLMLPEFAKIEQRRDLAQALMELGALVCSPKKPLCGECPIQAHCASKSVEKALLFPIKKGKAKSKVLHLAYVWIKTPQGYPLRQRASKGRFPSQWEPITMEAESEEEAKDKIRTYLNFPESSQRKKLDNSVQWNPPFRRNFTTYEVTWHEGWVTGEFESTDFQYFSESAVAELNLIPVMAKTWIQSTLAE